MIARLYHILSMLCIVIALTVVGLWAYLTVTGRFSPENRAVLAEWLRGEPLAEPEPESLEIEQTQPPAAAPSAADELALSEDVVERTNLLTQRGLEELRYKQDQLRNLQEEVRREREQLAALRVQFAEEIEQRRRQVDDEGFQRQLRLYETMEPRQVKDVFLGLPEELAARYLAAMNRQAAADVIGRFRTEAEQAKLQRLLQLMRDV